MTLTWTMPRESIADLGGIVIAYGAFQKTDQWKNGEKLNGLVPTGPCSSAERQLL